VAAHPEEEAAAAGKGGGGKKGGKKAAGQSALNFGGGSGGGGSSAARGAGGGDDDGDDAGGTAAEDDGDGDDGDAGLSGVATSLPISRVKKIAKLDPACGNLGKDAAYVLTLATELFLEALGEEALVVARVSCCVTTQWEQWQ
jgi:hypothetical protein